MPARNVCPVSTTARDVVVERPADLAEWLGARRRQRSAIIAVVADLAAVVAMYPLDDLTPVLDDDERRRCGRLRFAVDRLAYAASHAVLRAALGIVLGRSPAKVRFELRQLQFGPLRLEPDGMGTVPAVSLSHAGRFVALAVGERQALGIDIEPVRSLGEIEPLLESICAADERRTIESFPRDARARTILAAWTAKEAALKALGVGLAVPPQAAVIAYGIGGVPHAARVALDGDVHELQVRSFDPVGDGSAVAAVAAARGAGLHCAFGDATALLQRIVRSSSAECSTNRPTKRSAADRLRKNAAGSP